MIRRIMLNGVEMNPSAATVGIFDRGLQFGDGLFETLPVIDGQPIQLKEHLQRLQQGCERLCINWGSIAAHLPQEVRALCRQKGIGVLKIVVTRGQSERGYAFTEDIQPARILSIADWDGYPSAHAQQGIQTMLCRTPISENPALAGIKHLNRLDNVLARSELDESHKEGLMLDQAGRVVEGTMSNLFLIRDRVLITPPLEQAGVAGIMRRTILDLARKRPIKIRLADIDSELLKGAEEIFLSNSLIGIWPVIHITNVATYNKGPITTELQQTLYRRYSFLAGA